MPGYEHGSLGSPGPGLGRNQATAWLTTFHVAGFRPGSTVSLRLLDQDGVRVDRIVRRATIAADGTTDLHYVILDRTPPTTLRFEASGTDRSGAASTTGAVTVESRY